MAASAIAQTRRVHSGPAFVAQAPRASRRISRRHAPAVPAALPTAADLPVANDLPSQLAAMNAVRKQLRSAGWDDAWIDTVVGEVRKGKLKLDLDNVEKTIKYLTDTVGIPSKSVENMTAVAPDLLAAPLAQVQAIVEYAKAQGAGAALVSLLEEHPKLLTYTLAAGSKVLEKGQARASVDLADRHGRKVVGVSYWRADAAFETAPVAPYKPTPL
eukprot:scaffold1.g5319.t1